MLRLMLFLWFALLTAGPAVAQDCSTPRRAADSLFAWQQSDSYNLAKASGCLELADTAGGHRKAVHLRQILDARGILVPVSALPDTADAESPIVPVKNFPVLSLVRGDDGQWRYSRETIQAVSRLYSETFSPFSLWFQEQMPPEMHRRTLGFHGWQLAYLGILLLVAFLVGQALRLVLRTQVLRGLNKLGLSLDEQVYRRTNRPTVLTASLGVIYWGLSDLQLPIEVSSPAHHLVWASVWLAGLVAAYRFIFVAESVAKSWTVETESKLDDQLVPLARQAAQVSLIVVGGLYFADALGFDVIKLAAGVGIGGLAFALAAQDTVANVFGSVNIFVDKPFQIGDAVSVGGVEGVVEEVGFRSTRVRTFHNSLVTIPNSQITNANVDNLGLRHQRRQRHVIGLTYGTTADQISTYVERVRAVLSEDPEVADGPEVHLNGLGASSIDVLVHYHLVTDSWTRELELRGEHVLAFMRIAEEVGVSFAFPSTSVYVEQLPDSTP